ncbi:hypothetical protein L6R52_22140, partial [Myxococcota bacterium]|nr:hypothetical protein [Myxococcota bacterium]
AAPSSAGAFGGAGTNPAMHAAAAPEAVDATVPVSLGLDAPAGLADARPEPPSESEATVVGPISLDPPQPPKPGVPRRPLPPPRKPVPSTVGQKPKAPDDGAPTPAPDAPVPAASDDFLAAFEREFEDLKKT